MKTVTKFDQVLELVHKHFTNHNLYSSGWVFKFDDAKRRLGYCDYTKKTISISRLWADELPIEKIENTILHEIAHVLVGPHHGHDKFWQSTALAIGCDGQRCADTSDHEIPSLWKGTCPNGHVHSAHRAPLRVSSCSNCSRAFNVENMIEWKKNGKTVTMPKRYTSELKRLQEKYNVSILPNGKYAGRLSSVD